MDWYTATQKELRKQTILMGIGVFLFLTVPFAVFFFFASQAEEKEVEKKSVTDYMVVPLVDRTDICEVKDDGYLLWGSCVEVVA